jgi:hypothetical protein
MQDELQNFFSYKDLESRYAISHNSLIRFLKKHNITVNTIFGRKYISKAEIWSLESELKIVYSDNPWYGPVELSEVFPCSH